MTNFSIKDITRRLNPLTLPGGQRTWTLCYDSQDETEFGYGSLADYWMDGSFGKTPITDAAILAARNKKNANLYKCVVSVIRNYQGKLVDNWLRGFKRKTKAILEYTDVVHPGLDQLVNRYMNPDLPVIRPKEPFSGGIPVGMAYMFVYAGKRWRDCYLQFAVWKYPRAIVHEEYVFGFYNGVSSKRLLTH